MTIAERLARIAHLEAVATLCESKGWEREARMNRRSVAYHMEKLA